MGIRTTILAASASAILLAASMPPVGLGALAWVALVPALVAALRSPPGRATRAVVPLTYALYLELLLVPALPFGLTDNQWGETPIPLLIDGSPVLVVALVAVPLFGLALYALRFPAPAARLSAAAAIAVPAISWVALDFLRVKLDPGGLWGPLFASQHDSPAASLAALGGPWLISFAIVAVNCALALLIARGREALPAAAGVASTLALLALAGVAVGDRDRAEEITVAAVQPGYDTAEWEQPVLRYFRTGDYELAALDMIGDLGPLTRSAARRGAELVVWPEAALWVDPARTPAVREALGDLARSSGATLVVPYFVDARDQGATVTVTADGDLAPPQPKQRPMWFWGEDDGNRRPPQPVLTGAGEIGTTLGVDNQDPGPARLLAARGAAVVTSSTHDWRQLAPSQQAFAQLHARESQIPVVRADWRYRSAIFDSDGSRLADAGSERRRTVLVARVERRSGSTLYARTGDAFGWAALAAALSLAVGGAALRRSRASRARAASLPNRRPAPSSPS